MQCRLLWIAKLHITGEISQTYELKASCIALWSGQRTVGHTNLAACCRPQRATNVSKSFPAQMETRNTNCLLWRKSSNDASSFIKHVSKRTMASVWTHRQSHQPLDSSTPTRWRRRWRFRRQELTPQRQMMTVTTCVAPCGEDEAHRRQSQTQ